MQKLKYLSSLAYIFAVSPAAVLAQDTIDLKKGATGEFTQISGLSVPQLIGAGINVALVAAALISFFFLLVGGVQWILAGGDKEGTEKARKKITNALIGLAIVFSAYALALLVRTVFGVDIFTLRIKPVSEF